jgi:adenylate cyclase
MPDDPPNEAPTPAPTPEAPPPTSPELVAAHHLDAGHHHGHAQLPQFRFIEELKRRNVGRVAILYIVVSYVVLEVFEMFFHLLEMPPWTGRAAVLFAVLGFPIALLVAWAYEVTPDGLKPTDEVASQKSIARQTGRRLDRAIFVVMAVALAYFISDKFWLSRRGADATPVITAAASATPTALPVSAASTVPDKSVAVLPFVDMSEKKNEEYIADGVAVDILDLLAKVPDLKVIGSASSFQIRGSDADLRTIGTKFGVANILEGSVRKSGERLRITTQLIDVQTGERKWSQSYDREFRDVLKVQDEIAASVVRALRLVLNDSLPARPSAKNPEAYRLFLEGRFLADGASKVESERAVATFREALTLDPDYAPAWSELSITLQNQIEQHGLDVRSTITEARKAALRALELDPTSIRGLEAMFYIDLDFDWDFVKAGQIAEKAKELRPDNADALTMQSELSRLKGQWDQSAGFLRQALARDPLSAGLHRQLAYTLYCGERFTDAEVESRRVLQLDPEASFTRAWLGLALMLQHRLADALATAQLEPNVGDRLQALAVIYWAMGRRAEANDALSGFARQTPAPEGGIAWVHAHRGEIDDAFAWFDKALDKHDPSMLDLRCMPGATAFVGDARYKLLLSKVKLPE